MEDKKDFDFKLVNKDVAKLVDNYVGIIGKVILLEFQKIQETAENILNVVKQSSMESNTKPKSNTTNSINR